jgi:glycosyltransferase involved in cell wall biosynthesis
VKLAVVVQRYGQAINGGAELHARYVAEHLAKHAEVEVLTTCAEDYVTWRNDLRPSVEPINGVQVRRFRVKRERDPKVFGQRSHRVFTQTHSVNDELRWLDAEGPTTPRLIDYLARNGAQYDYCLFFSYRYYHAYYGVRATSPRAILVPTAERDAAIGLAIFRSIFRGVRAVMYNSHEERAMIQAASQNEDVPGVVVGIGSEVPQSTQPGRFRQKYNISGPFAVYIGRIDKNKGCEELFEFFQAYLRGSSSNLSLVLIGHSLLPIPDDPRIRHLGFLDDADKFDALAAADLLIMPSYFESLSMVALEAWALGRPVLANGKCDVLKGQCIRSNAGLYYESLPEFIGTLRAIERNRWLSTALGKNGRMFFREHYDWPVLERKYLDMFARLSKEPGGKTLPPLPGWLDRRRQELSPAETVAAELPKGPVVEPRRNDSSALHGKPYSAAVPDARTRALPQDHRAERFGRSGSKPSAHRRRYGGGHRRGGPHR